MVVNIYYAVFSEEDNAENCIKTTKRNKAVWDAGALVMALGIDHTACPYSAISFPAFLFSNIY